MKPQPPAPANTDLKTSARRPMWTQRPCSGGSRVFRARTGVAWRDLPERFGQWQTVWKRHHRFATDRTWDMLRRVVQSEADAAGRVDWSVPVDSSIVRAHQHAATAKRVVREVRARREEHIGRRTSRSAAAAVGPWEILLGRRYRRTRRAAASRGDCPSTADDNRKGSTRSSPFPIYTAPGGLRQAPGRAA
jgi:transposase